MANGRPIGELSKREWARKVTFVPQASRLIAGTSSPTTFASSETMSPTPTSERRRSWPTSTKRSRPFARGTSTPSESTAAI